MIFSVEAISQEQLQQSREINATTSCPHCNGGDSVDQPKLYSRILEGQDPCSSGNFYDSIVELFGYPFVMVSLPSKIKEVFLLFNQHLQQVEDCQDVETEQYVFQEGKKFLHILECYVHRFLVGSKVSSHSVSMAIANELQWVCNWLSPSSGQSTFHDRLHLYTFWSSLAITYRLIPVIGTAEFLSQATCVAKKLLDVASVQFKQQGCGSSLFTHDIIKEVWLTLYHTLSSLSAATAPNTLSSRSVATTNSLHCSQSFWIHVTDLLTQQEVRGRETFCWWLLACLSRVCEGNYWKFVEEHLLSSSFSASVSETQLRPVIQCAGVLTHHWAPSLVLFSKAWEFFYKNMNASRFNWISPTSISTASQWAHCTTNWECSCTNQITAPIALTSYELFLVIISCTMSCHERWTVVRGRIYSKCFNTSWISKLEPCGVRRLVSLFLTLTNRAPDHHEVGNKVVRNLANCLDGHPNSECGNILWRGVFAHLVVLYRHGLDLTPVCKLLTSHIHHLVAQLSAGRSYDILWVVLGSIQELLENRSACDQGATVLIGSLWLSELLSQHPSLDGAQLTRMLLFVEGVASSLAEHSAVSSSTNLAAYSNLLKLCLPVLISLSKSSSPSSQLVSTAATLYHLASCCSRFSAQCSQDKAQMVKDFGLSEDCNPRIASGFLCHILSDESCCPHLSEDEEWKVAHCWLRCLLLLSGDSQGLTQFTKLVVSLPYISSMIQTKSIEPMSVLKQILTTLNTNFSNTYMVSAEECGKWRSRLRVLLGDLMKYVEAACNGSVNMQRMVMLVASSVVSICPRIIYSRLESKCLLPLLVDRLVLPLANRPTAPVKAYLHLFIIGLLKLDPNTDSFIKRKLHQIYGKYFLVYAEQSVHPLTQHTAKTNPFLSLVEKCKDSHPSQEVQQRLLFTVELIASKHLTNTRKLTSLLPVLQYVVACLGQVVNQNLLESCSKLLLTPLLTCLLACHQATSHPEPQVKEKVLHILRILLKERDHSDMSFMAVKHYLMSNLPIFKEHALKPLFSIVNMLPSLKEQLVSVSMSTVLEVVESGADRIRMTQQIDLLNSQK